MPNWPGVRVRYFTDGAVLGSREFVEECFARLLHSLSVPILVPPQGAELAEDSGGGAPENSVSYATRILPARGGSARG